MPEVGGLVLYLTGVVTCVRPSITGLLSTQRPFFAAVARSEIF